MRVVLDTNVLISALITPQGLSFKALKLWQENRYDLVTSSWQLEEVRSVTQRARVRKHLKPGAAGTLINALQAKAFAGELPPVDSSTDPDDNNSLATAIAGGAHYLVSGDKTDLQALEKVQGVRILTLQEFVEMMALYTNSSMAQAIGAAALRCATSVSVSPGSVQLLRFWGNLMLARCPKL